MGCSDAAQVVAPDPELLKGGGVEPRATPQPSSARSLDRLNLDVLQALLRSYGLDDAGKKPELLKRLQAYLAGPSPTGEHTSGADVLPAHGRVLSLSESAPPVQTGAVSELPLGADGERPSGTPQSSPARSLDRLNLEDLQLLLRGYGLDDAGKKPDLLNRLQACLAGPSPTGEHISGDDVLPSHGRTVPVPEPAQPVQTDATREPPIAEGTAVRLPASSITFAEKVKHLEAKIELLPRTEPKRTLKLAGRELEFEWFVQQITTAVHARLQDGKLAEVSSELRKAILFLTLEGGSNSGKTRAAIEFLSLALRSGEKKDHQLLKLPSVVQGLTYHLDFNGGGDHYVAARDAALAGNSAFVGVRVFAKAMGTTLINLRSELPADWEPEFTLEAVTRWLATAKRRFVAWLATHMVNDPIQTELSRDTNDCYKAAANYITLEIGQKVTNWPAFKLAFRTLGWEVLADVVMLAYIGEVIDYDTLLAGKVEVDDAMGQCGIIWAEKTAPGIRLFTQPQVLDKLALKCRERAMAAASPLALLLAAIRQGMPSCSKMLMGPRLVRFLAASLAVRRHILFTERTIVSPASSAASWMRVA
ncbi:hypothetical protein WJX72_004450 [[Myrmecia] bisecta]|uniref:SAP domain-containing protein n=1 Tax=[Myrmecia] bisecta TaxID=41462 RepID=A0AAW1QQC9_9CHLO